MYFLVEAHDHDGALAKRLALREAHVAYWAAQGEVVAAAGAILSSDGEEAVPIGSMLIVEAEGRAEVAGLLARDPFTLHGVFSGYIAIRRWRPGIGRWLAP